MLCIRLSMRPYKSGKAKADFLADVEKRRAEAEGGSMPKEGTQVLTVDVNGKPYRVTVAFGDTALPAQSASSDGSQQVTASGEGKDVLSPLEGKFYLTKRLRKHLLK